MPDPEIGFLFDAGYDSASWHESMLEPRQDVLSPDRSSCTVTVVINYSQYKAAVRFILGYAWVDDNKNLRRSTPVFHPLWPWLYASAITGTTFKGPTAANTVTLPFDFAVYAGGYTFVEITVEFRERLYDLWQDWEVDTEDERFVYQTREPYVELAQIDGGQLKYYAPSVAGVDGNTIAAPYILAPLAKAKILLQWFQVPTEFVEDADGFSTKFQAAEKCVNDATFRGRRAGTLFLEHVHLQKNPSPVATDIEQGLRFTYDITFEMIEYDPTPGDSAVTKYGHNLMPGPKSAGATGERVTKFYYVTDDGTLTGKPLFASYSFPKLFTHYSLT